MYLKEFDDIKNVFNELIYNLAAIVVVILIRTCISEVEI